VDNGAAAQIEEILANAAIACSSSLPPANVGQRVLNCYPLTQLSTSLLSLLTLA
jgi:hypothetical protein